MNVTRKVVMDLIPLYAAGEVSDESRQIVEEFLKNDPELAELVKRMAGNGQRGAPPALTSRDAELKAFMQAKRIMLARTIIWVLAAALGAVIVLIFFGRIH
jgi:anti-sigma factor RsiW